ncbi:MAG: heme exporter protein CcmD [Rhodospirillales bacterium]|nr:heme exporter protein CcmD [Rhodospirillales bacterium]
MNPIPYVIAAYAVGVVVVGWLCIDAVLRLRSARRRLAAAEAGRVRR